MMTSKKDIVNVLVNKYKISNIIAKAIAKDIVAIEKTKKKTRRFVKGKWKKIWQGRKGV